MNKIRETIHKGRNAVETVCGKREMGKKVHQENVIDDQESTNAVEFQADLFGSSYYFGTPGTLHNI